MRSFIGDVMPLKVPGKPLLILGSETAAIDLLEKRVQNIVIDLESHDRTVRSPYIPSELSIGSSFDLF